jgi:hypothetical protein
MTTANTGSCSLLLAAVTRVLAKRFTPCSARAALRTAASGTRTMLAGEASLFKQDASQAFTLGAAVAQLIAALHHLLFRRPSLNSNY